MFVTAGGYTCQYWNVDEPHSIHDDYKLEIDDHNYCRNPDDDSNGPWWFTTDPDTIADYCSIPKCDGKY